MFSKTDVTLENCTHALAKTFAAMPALVGERPLKPVHLAFLRAHLHNGTFVSPTWAVVVDKVTGTRYRANGQHSSTILAELSDAEYPADLMVTIEEYTTDDLEKDAFSLFDLFDNPASARDNVDVMNLHRVHFLDLQTLQPKLILTLAGGIALYEKGVKNGKFLAVRERGLYLVNDEYRRFIVWAAGFEKAVHGWMLKKPGVVAEMLAERRADEDAANAFWPLVFTESHPDVDHETRELSRTLKDLVSKPKVPQDRFRRETDKQWKRFRRLRKSGKPIEMEYEASPGPQPEASEATA